MLKSLLRIFGNGHSLPTEKRPVTAPKPAPATPVATGTPVYPPVDQGVSFGKSEAVLTTQEYLIKRLRLLAGLSIDEFDRLYGGVLRSLANYIDLLPASESGTHMGAGGLFRLALEIGFFSRQSCEAVLFAGRVGVELRRDLEPRWRYATFLAGLCCELHRPLSRMIVVSEDGQEWPIHRMALSEWLSSIGATRYFVRWVKEGESFAGGSASLLATKIIPEASLQYLQEGHTNIIPAMLDAIIADISKTRDNQIAEIIARIRRKVIERDQVLAPQNYGKLTVGAQLEPHLIDAMRQLVSGGIWTINVKKARIWYGPDGMFVVWRTAAKEIIDVLERGSVSGMPRDPTTIAEILLRAGVFVADKNNDLYWKIKTPLSENELVAVRLANPEILLVAIEDEKPAALQTNLAVCTSVAVDVSKPTAGAVSRANTPIQVIEQGVSGKPPESETTMASVPPSSTPSAMPAPPPAQEGNSGKKGKPKPLPEELQPGAITPVQESLDFALPEDIAQRMTTLVREVIAQVLRDYHSGILQGAAEATEDGLAIALEKLGEYGVEVTKIVTELHGLGWLFIDPVNPKKKIHMVQIGGQSVQSAIFKRQVAQDLGFPI